jgi:K(+)-stimulated pyrophosphate-energized sodium pump
VYVSKRRGVAGDDETEEAERVAKPADPAVVS